MEYIKWDDTAVFNEIYSLLNYDSYLLVDGAYEGEFEPNEAVNGEVFSKEEMVEKPRVFDPRGRSCADPRKRFYFDPLRALAGGVIFISPYLPVLAALILRTLSPVSSI